MNGIGNGSAGTGGVGGGGGGFLINSLVFYCSNEMERPQKFTFEEEMWWIESITHLRTQLGFDFISIFGIRELFGWGNNFLMHTTCLLYSTNSILKNIKISGHLSGK